VATLPKKIVFGFFNGESWGYLGSKKLLDDLKTFRCEQWSEDKTRCLQPDRAGIEFSRIALDHVDAIVELKQVGAIQPGKNISLFDWVLLFSRNFDFF
jgi:hypothetical protein